MTFLQPWILWGLPLVLVPVVIHLLNRLRHRSLSWAAMSFLLAASRQSRRQARLRHWLVLLCRVLAVLALLLALARPLVGGWLGWAMSGAPDTVILLLDRSASMELQDPPTHASKRQDALRRFATAARSLGAAARLVLIENAGRAPQEIAPATLLSDSPLVAATDTAADIPALLEAAVDYVLANQCGQTEFWLASDLQASNWHPDSPRWPALVARLAALPQEVRVRLLALTADAPDNLAVSLPEVRRQKIGDHSRLDLTIDIARRATAPVTLPLSVVVDGARSLVTVKLDGQQVRLHHQIDLGTRTGGGWGAVELPPDANPRDNVAFFSFNPEAILRALVASDDAVLGRVLQVATVPAPTLMNEVCTVARTANAGEAVGKDTALVVWQGAGPGLRGGGWLQHFVENGGVVVAFPESGERRAESGERRAESGERRAESGERRAESGERRAESGERKVLSPVEGRKEVTVTAVWGAVETAAAGKPWRVTSWRRNDGPLAATQDGADLPVNDLVVTRRQVILGGDTVLAAFADGQPFLVRRALGKGALYFCATLPQADWSNLGDGLVLVPMLQRLLADGGQRLGQAAQAVCGEQPVAPGEIWTRLDKPGPAAAGHWEAGVYRVGDRLVALNRPVAEDTVERLDEATVRSLFGATRLRFFEEKAAAAGRLESEAWRICLGALVLLLLAEGWLTLTGPGPARYDSADRGDAVPPHGFGGDAVPPNDLAEAS